MLHTQIVSIAETKKIKGGTDKSYEFYGTCVQGLVDA